jgi:hypothetical protein
MRADFTTHGMLTNPPLVAAILDVFGNGNSDNNNKSIFQDSCSDSTNNDDSISTGDDGDATNANVRATNANVRATTLS